LINADVLSRKTSPKDRNSYPLIGDAAAITVVERRSHGFHHSCHLKMDGTRNNVLLIPAGGFACEFTSDRGLGGCRRQ